MFICSYYLRFVVVALRSYFFGVSFSLSLSCDCDLWWRASELAQMRNGKRRRFNHLFVPFLILFYYFDVICVVVCYLLLLCIYRLLHTDNCKRNVLLESGSCVSSRLQSGRYPSIRRSLSRETHIEIHGIDIVYTRPHSHTHMFYMQEKQKQNLKQK